MPPPPATIYLGRFISAPHPGPSSALQIREGAVLVNITTTTTTLKPSYDSADPEHPSPGPNQPTGQSPPEGRIEKVDWDVSILELEEDGEVRRRFGVGGEEEDEGEVEVVRCGEGGFFFPGFVDTHIHAPQYPNTGIFGQSTLLDWLETYTFPLESSFGNPDSPFYNTTSSKTLPGGPPPKPDPLTHAHRVYSRLLTRTLSHGTTTAAYYATIHVAATNLLASLALQFGQRALIGRVCMDEPQTCPTYYRDESTEASIANSRACVAYCRTLDPGGLRVIPVLTPRFALSCRASTLKALGELANETAAGEGQSSPGLRIQTHISENLTEVAMVASLFPASQSYTHVYDDAGLLTPRTILAHAVHLSPVERALIVERKAKVAHCPASNSALGSGYCAVRALLDEGIEVGLGTDVSGGFSVGVLEVVRQAYLVSRTVGFYADAGAGAAIPAAVGEGEGEEQENAEENGTTRSNIGVVEGLHLATVGGANVVGFEGQMGGFEVGMLWDVQEIGLGDEVPVSGLREDGSEGAGVGGGGRAGEGGGKDGVEAYAAAAAADGGAIDVFGWESWEDRVAKWVWSGDDRNVKRVWVGGRLVHQRRR